MGGGDIDIAVARIWEGRFVSFRAHECCYIYGTMFSSSVVLAKVFSQAPKEGRGYLMTDCLGGLLAVSAGRRANTGNL